MPEYYDNRRKKKLRNSICLLNKNYVYLASESPRGINFTSMIAICQACKHPEIGIKGFKCSYKGHKKSDLD